MDNERYKAWLHRRVEKSDQSLAKHGLTKKSDPQEKPLLEAARMKAAGVKPGVPDMFLPVAREGCHGLYIELKRRDGGRVSTEQTAWMDALARQGYKTALCHGWDAAREEIQRYLGGKWSCG